MDANASFYSEGKTLDKVKVQCKNNEAMSSIFEKFSNKVGAKLNDFDFFYKGKKIKETSTINSLKNSKEANDIDILFKRRSKIMKCPECICNNCVIKVDKYRLNFTECCHEHKSKNIIFDKYEGSQNIELDKIRCNKCQKSQNDDLKDFTKCLRCSKQFKYAIYYCYECSLSHAHSQFMIKYDEKYYYCEDHFKLYQSYCSTCNTNLCESCEMNHKNKNHRLLKFEKMAPSLNPIKSKLEEIKLRIEDLKIVVDQIKNNMDGAVRIMEQYYDIAQDIISKYESFNKKFTNFQVLKTVSSLNFSNNEILQDLIQITEGDLDLKEKCDMLIDIYKSDRNNYTNYSQPMMDININNENMNIFKFGEQKNSESKKKIVNQKKMDINSKFKGNFGKKK